MASKRAATLTPSPKMSSPLRNHVAEVNPDPELDPLLGRHPDVPIGHPPLDLDRAPDGINHACKLGQKAVAGVFYEPAAMLFCLRVHQLREVGLQPFVRPLLICTHQARISRYIGGKQGGKAADRGHLLRSVEWGYQIYSKTGCGPRVQMAGTVVLPECGSMHCKRERTFTPLSPNRRSRPIAAARFHR
jgi:hypothetical protein